jgi:glycosyltransferase involved in cell wall biosynthesis
MEHAGSGTGRLRSLRNSSSTEPPETALAGAVAAPDRPSTLCQGEAPRAGPGLRKTRLATNSPALLGDAERWQLAEGRLIPEDATLAEVRRAVSWLAEGGILLLDAGGRLMRHACMLARLSPRRRWRFIALDIILAPAEGILGRLKARAASLLLGAVDEHLLYFCDTAGYSRYYGIPPRRMRYVPFKVNCWAELRALPPREGDGDYLLCVGRTRRDLGTFLEAARRAHLPCVLLHQPASIIRQHGTELPIGPAASNVRWESHDGASHSWIEWIRNARAVVIPLLPGTIGCAGISTYLDAMALGVPVIITDGPATRGLLTDEALIVDPGDPGALATALRQVWHDADLRHGYIARGRAYAERMGGAERLHRDVLATALGSCPAGSSGGRRARSCGSPPSQDRQRPRPHPV